MVATSEVQFIWGRGAQGPPAGAGLTSPGLWARGGVQARWRGGGGSQEALAEATVASPTSHSCTFLGRRVALDPRSLSKEGRVPGDFQKEGQPGLGGL